MKKKLWCDKGRTGEMLRAIRDRRAAYGVFKVGTGEFPGMAYIENPNTAVGITLRGNSHDRRKQRRALQRWLNEARPGVVAK